MAPTYDAKLVLTDEAGNTKTLIGQLSDGDFPGPEPENSIDFSADFRCRDPDYVMEGAQDWNDVFSAAISQGVTIQCLEQNTDAFRHDFTISDGGRNGGNCMRVFMPKGSYGMGHRSVNINLGSVNGPVNVEFDFMIEPAKVPLFTKGNGGKWGAAIQYGVINSSSAGGLRFMPVWPAGTGSQGQQDLCVALQDQRSQANGGPANNQWLQPPYYAYRNIEYNHWYSIRLRMTGGAIDAPGAVLCEYWKDDDPVMKYEAATNNPNVLQGNAPVTVDWTCFFGGTAVNAAPADAYFRYGEKFRVWVEA